MFYCIEHPGNTAEEMDKGPGGYNFPRCPICHLRMIRGTPGDPLIVDLHNAGVPLKDLIRATEAVGGYNKEFGFPKQRTYWDLIKDSMRLMWYAVQVLFWVTVAKVVMFFFRKRK